MGEARRRGTSRERKSAATARSKRELIEAAGGRDEIRDSHIRSGLELLKERLRDGEWNNRRKKIISALNTNPQGRRLENAKSIRVREDEIGWYIFLAEQWLNDPLCIDVNQAARNLPFVSSLGEKSQYRHRITGLEEKLDELLGKFKSEPDGTIFEILTAFSYAAEGWDVEFLAEIPGKKTPDLLVKKDNRELFIECKRQSRRSDYAEDERKEFLRRWDKAKGVVFKNKQWLWFKCEIHTEVKLLPENFLKDIFEKSLPISQDEVLVFDGPEATVSARRIDWRPIKKHFSENLVKQNSPTLNEILGGDWALPTDCVTVQMIAKSSQVVDCDADILGCYIEDVDWVCGISRIVDSEDAINSKARDIKKLLARAVKQVPKDKESIIHLAVETLEGNSVEHRRTEKVMASIPAFTIEKLVSCVRLHSFRPQATTDKLWDFEETVQTFNRSWARLEGIPDAVVLPSESDLRDGNHWD
ncbi:hypothetical protein [Marinobacter xiaoshiensis]|uniref:Restriction endonuclease n=1 Tax=Marinobacter xiaoshiensis TaxID=3073652 RepID=A0ABU2HJG4_9GAMM|nr:hypothetical protein [Marinobacter sp. F60267]MDS1310751.1 hypothetical protein [Marinobacter sp. F60267]